MSMLKLAEAIGIPQATLSRLENGKRIEVLTLLKVLAFITAVEGEA